ncbi:hypothetical protein [Peribacillus muralis]|uniref:hypothetical protein n=1 Tax=Peribacillus muralis TaxID=264697 RepID=UPI003CFC78BB
MKLRDYYCTNCDWEAKGTIEFSDIKKCPKCERHSVMSKKPERYCRHVCLDCGHEDRVEGCLTEVVNCPKCNGLYVDTFRVIHYQALLRPDKTKDEITAYCKGCGYKVKGTKDFLERCICPECKRGSDTPKEPEDSVSERAYSEDVYLDARKITKAATYTNINASEPVIPLLTITLDYLNSVPTIHYKGKEISSMRRVSFDFKTDAGNDKCPTYPTYIHLEREIDQSNTELTQKNKPHDRD